MVQDLIDTTRRMKEQLEPTLIKETQIKLEKREVLPETREIDRIENELNKTKEETETKIQEETNRHEVTETQIVTETETREIEGGLKGPKDEHTHMELARLNGGELADCVVTRCGQLDSLLQERRETLCSLEADHDQVGSVVPSELEGASAVDQCTRSLGVWSPREPLW